MNLYNILRLIDSAVRYTYSGGQVDVRLHRSESQAVIDIIDTGCGISVGFEAHIFDRFYRAAP